MHEVSITNYINSRWLNLQIRKFIIFRNNRRESSTGMISRFTGLQAHLADLLVSLETFMGEYHTDEQHPQW